MSSLSRECADKGADFEEIAFERAEELMLQEQLGINPQLTVAYPPPQMPAAKTEEEEEEDEDEEEEDDEEEMAQAIAAAKSRQ